MIKKYILWISFFVSTFLIIVDRIGNVIFCSFLGYYDGHVYSCLDFISPIETMLFPLLPVFLFSLITYKMRDEVFQTWIKFTKWFIPLSMFLILITPTANGGYFVSLWDNQMTAIFTSFLYTLLSLILIIYKSIKLRGK